MPFHEKWIVQEGFDYNTWSHAAFCHKEDYLAIDTITLDFGSEPNNPNKFKDSVGSIYMFPGQPGQMDGAGVYGRKYAKLLEKLN